MTAGVELPHAASRLRMPEYRGRHGAGRDAHGPCRESREVPAESRRGGRASWCGDRGSDAIPMAHRSTENLRDSEVAASGSFAPPRSRCDHIRVAVRVRPLPPGEEGIIEVAGSEAIAIRKEAATGGNEALKSQQGRVEERVFNHVFGPEASQKEVYAWSCAPLVAAAVSKGRSATIFVYGATGAGKTHTMFGSNDKEQQGLIVRSIVEVFDSIARQGKQWSGSSGDVDPDAEGSLEVKVSFLEIYNEVVRDLLQGGGGGQCRVLEDERKGVVKIANLVEATVRTPDEALWYLKAGMQARTVEATAANAQSSRAHAVFTLNIESVKLAVTGSGAFARRTEVRTQHCKISLIDLAGSERAGVTQNSGSALKDGARINQSLLALANCIDALTAKGPNNASTPRKKPPYRDSKLTLMLKGSLVGDGMVAMIANVHPGRSHFEDSNNTLEYAKRASTVKTAAAAMQRRASRTMDAPAFQGTQSSRSGSGDDEPTDEGCIASSSSLPAPQGSTSNLTRRRMLDRNRVEKSHVAAPKAHGSFAEPSPEAQEECMSEISLSSPGGAEFETPGHHDIDLDLDVEAAGIELSAGEGSTSATSSADGPGKASETEKENLQSLGRCGSTPARPSSRFACNPLQISAEISSFQKMEALETEKPSLCRAVSAWTSSEPELTNTEIEAGIDMVVALQLIKKLQAEKSLLDTRLDIVFRERNALLEDRRSLEEENCQLRAFAADKDRQMVLLLTARGQQA